jgi:cysteine desulfurase
MDHEGRQGSRVLRLAVAPETDHSDAKTLRPDSYAHWRSSLLGTVTERIEREAVLASAGQLEGLSVLDTGCGDGAYSLLAWRHGARVTAIDTSDAMPRAARGRALAEGAKIDFVHASVECLPFAAESFDVVLMVTLLCLVNDASHTLREAHRVLRSGGRLIVGELGAYSLWALKRRLSGWLGNSFWREAHFWTAHELHELLTKEGFRVESTKGSIYYSPIGCAARAMCGAEGILSHLGGIRCRISDRESRQGVIHMSDGTSRIYLDFNASTPLAPEVRAMMAQMLEEPYGNPSSSHWAGKPARQAVEDARSQVARLLACKPSEIVFTSGGSEANNHALKGAFFAAGRRGVHIITTQVEHPAIINPCRFLERLGASVTYLPVDKYGRVNPEHVRAAIRPETILVSVMHANNEVGTIQPIAEISRIIRGTGILLHTDAAQSVGKIGCNVEELGVDFLSVAGHKLYGPKGVGALYIREGVFLEPLIHGAGHESGRRAGTESVLLNAALGVACEVAAKWIGMEPVRILRDYFWDRLQSAFGERVVMLGHPAERLPNTLNVGFVGRNGADILSRMPRVAASTGSACHSGSVELSPVLQAMGIPPEIGMGAIRFSLGRGTTQGEIEAVVEDLIQVVES